MNSEDIVICAVVTVLAIIFVTVIAVDDSTPDINLNCNEGTRAVVHIDEINKVYDAECVPL